MDAALPTATPAILSAPGSLAARCSSPIRLAGERLTVNRDTGEIVERFASSDAPFRVVLLACGNRRASRCQSCSDVYRHDAYALVRAGVAGDAERGVPLDVSSHPRIFATFTAPSFGAVHRRVVRGASALPCRPRASQSACAHDRPLFCPVRHDQNDQAIGQPLCPDCYDYKGAVLWNAHAGALWRRTTIAMTRLLAARVGVPRSEISNLVRLSFVKVAEFQSRGLVHLHVILRLDGPGPRPTAPPKWATSELLAEIVSASVVQTSLRTQRPDGEPFIVRWGVQLDIRPIRAGIEGEGTDTRVAGYLAKYATKAAESAGGADRPLRSPYEIDLLPATDHARSMMATCWALGSLAQYEHLRLRAWAHMLGFRGHFLTKARRYSITFRALRTSRVRYRANLAMIARGLNGVPALAEESTLVIAAFAFAGVGAPGLADLVGHQDGSAP
jgi:hypothetical protein